MKKIKKKGILGFCDCLFKIDFS